jgi:predicted enzyme related to lactoylglutathione lyase
MNKKEDIGLIVFFGTEDINATHHFYVDVFGLTLHRDQGICRIYDVEGGGRLGFCQHIKVVKDEKSPIITLVTEDVDGVYKKLKEKGAVIKHPPKENNKFNIYHFFLQDPNGYTLEVQKFLD